MTPNHSMLEAMRAADLCLDVFNVHTPSRVFHTVSWLIVLGPSSPKMALDGEVQNPVQVNLDV